MPRFITLADRMRAVALRRRGKTYSEIRKEIKISKGTLSYWSKKIKLSPTARVRLQKTQNIHLIQARIAGIATLRKKQAEFLDNLRKSITPKILEVISPKTLKIALAFLHLGEGAKWKAHRGLQLGSSDPLIILLYMKLLGVCYGIDKNKFRCYICYRADQDLRTLRKYWSGVLDIPTDRFYKSKPDPRTIGKITKNKGYKGVCVVSCGGSAIQQELELIPNIILEKGL